MKVINLDELISISNCVCKSLDHKPKQQFCFQFHPKYQMLFLNQHQHQNNSKMDVVFTVVANICNIIGASAKHRDILWEAQANEILKGVETGELSTRRDLNQEMWLKRAGDTGWSSHYYAMLNLIVFIQSCDCSS